ncbi:MAG: hypothetical protein QM813_15570 [Verrucomicrobiota bacterium]
MYIRNLTQTLIRFVVLLLAGVFATFATEASLLKPGTKTALYSAHEPQGAHLLAVTNFNFSSANLTGNLQSKVWADDESNPFGGLTFSYRLVNTGECEDFLGWFSLSGFAGLGVDVNFFGGGVAPLTAMRSASGDMVSFGFFDREADKIFEPGNSSAWLIIQTSAHTWGVNSFVGVDAETVTAAAFAPVTVPEPTTVAFAALLGAVLLARRKGA